MYKTRSNLSIKWLIFVALILNSCSDRVVTSGKTPAIDRSFITGEVCDPPCWYGLEINKSTKEDVLSTLDQLRFVDSHSYKEYETYWLDGSLTTAIQYGCVKSNANPCGILTFYKGMLKKNWLTVNYDLRLEKAIERLGTPDYLTYLWPSPSGICEISVLWIEKGITISFHDRNKRNECESVIDGNGVSRGVLVETVLYTSREVLEATFNLPGGCCKSIKWPGFRDR